MATNRTNPDPRDYLWAHYGIHEPTKSVHEVWQTKWGLVDVRGRTGRLLRFKRPTDGAQNYIWFKRGFYGSYVSKG